MARFCPMKMAWPPYEAHGTCGPSLLGAMHVHAFLSAWHSPSEIRPPARARADFHLILTPIDHTMWVEEVQKRPVLSLLGLIDKSLISLNNSVLIY